jgi:hypothetical protein
VVTARSKQHTEVSRFVIGVLAAKTQRSADWPELTAVSLRPVTRPPSRSSRPLLRARGGGGKSKGKSKSESKGRSKRVGAVAGFSGF